MRAFLAPFIVMTAIFFGVVSPGSAESADQLAIHLAYVNHVEVESVLEYSHPHVVTGEYSPVNPSAIDLGPTPVVLEVVDPTAVGESPFGFHPAGVFEPGYQDNGYLDAQSIGVRWTREGIYAFWFLVQPNLNQQVYDFTLYDRQWLAVPEGINILANIAPQGHLDEGRCLPGSWIPVDLAEYVAFVEATVERYDGDGIGEGDFDGGVFQNPVKYWQVGNEPNERTTSGFALLQQITYQAIKTSCPDCTVLIGGVAGFPENYVAFFDTNFAPILNELAGQYMDVFDFHWYGSATGDYRLADTVTGEDVYDHVRGTLVAAGFPADMPIWITEMGAYSGDPGPSPFPPFRNPPYQTERQQAGDYFKRFLFSLSRGVVKVFPAFGLMEGFKYDDGYFDHTGLIYDGEDFGNGADPETGGDPGLGVKKLSYYTYKKMTEKLEGADWTTLTMLHDGAGADWLYVFRVETPAGNIQIAWWDAFADETNSTSQTLILAGLTGTAMQVTSVIPEAAIGAEVNDFKHAFRTRIIPVVDGVAVVDLDEDPVLIEELQLPHPRRPAGRSRP